MANKTSKGQYLYLQVPGFAHLGTHRPHMDAGIVKCVASCHSGLSYIHSTSLYTVANEPTGAKLDETPYFRPFFL